MTDAPVPDEKPTVLAAAFADRLKELGRELTPALAGADTLEALAGDIALEARLGEMLAQGRARWPGIAVEDWSYAGYVAERLPPSDDAELTPATLPSALETLHAADLYLACGCAAALPAAQRALDRELLPEVRPALGRMALGDDAIDDVLARLREALLLGDGNRPPRIVHYAGRGALVAWLRAAAVREAIGLLRRQRPEPVAGDDDELLARASGTDPELEHARQVYGEAVQRAFAEAVASLEAHERTLLRQHLIDRLTIDELAGLHQVHRATAARWVSAARLRLVERTRRHLMRTLRIGPEELRSLVRLVQSQFGLSLSRELR